MLFEIFKFEIKYRIKRADTYIYFAVLFLYSIIAVDFLYEGALDPIKRNAPIVVARTMGIVSALFMMITSMIMGVAALRDFDHHMESLIFINPIKKGDYLFGRFLGSFTILVVIFSGLPLGMMLGDLMPWHTSDSLLAFNLWAYLQPFFVLVLPTLFFGAAIFFVSGALSKKLMVVYTQGILFLMIYLVSIQFAKSGSLFYVSLFEPFTFQSISIITQYWTVPEKNLLFLSFEDVLLYNRLIWIAIGGVVLWIGYCRFQFKVMKDQNFKRNKDTMVTLAFPKIEATTLALPISQQHFHTSAMLKMLYYQSLFHFKAVLKEVPFWAMVICSMAIILISSINLGTAFGVDSYPTTYIILGELLENTIIFFLMIILFYSGELVWKERDKKMNYFYDALPVSDSIQMTGKFIGLVLVYTVLILCMIVAGIIFQISKGYYILELDVYFTGFFFEIFPFLFLLSVVSFFFQTLINHKFIAHIAVLIFAFIPILLRLKGIAHGLYTFGGNDLGSYSDMNGYGHFLIPYMWLKVYWIAFSALLFLLTILISVRGVEPQFRKRLRQVKMRFTRPLKHISWVLICIFIGAGSFIFYNTNILHSYAFESTQNMHRANYEKTLKGFEFLAQPQIRDVHINLELYPADRDYTAEGYYMLYNPHEHSIKEVHIQKLPSDEVHYKYLTFENGATVKEQYNKFGYTIHQLNMPLQPGDSLKMNFKQLFTTIGFTESSDNNIVYNGTFFTNFHFPTIGYTDDIEIDDNDTRQELGLQEKVGRAKINNGEALRSGRNDGDGEEINFEMIIGTEKDQVAVTSGDLLREWTENNRSYVHYKSNEPMSHFYAILSARYEIVKEQWISAEKRNDSPIALEIYHHPGHTYNVDRMMKGMRKSFDYYTDQFSPYQYQQMRIVEVPNYRKRAQSFPNTVPFSENIGFILDIDDKKDVDMAFFVTAHEVAHQWWGHQVNPANVQGKAMISESLAQYAALMVMKKEYPEEKVQQLLDVQRDRYLKERSLDKNQEMPLHLVDTGQDYVHYGKGLINLNTFQDYVSEDSVNIALKRFIRDWNSFNGLKKKETDQYTTTKNLLNYFRMVTPDSLQYVISDLFETITIYDNEAETVSFSKVEEGNYKVHLKLNVLKFKVNELGQDEQVKINDWIDIGVYNEDQDLIYLKKHQIKSKQVIVEITVNQEPFKAGVDPLHMLMDRDEDDNVMIILEK